MTIVVRNNINIATLGDARRVMKMEGDNAALPIGVIYGLAEKVKVTSGMDKAGNETTFDKVIGSFEGVPSETREETVNVGTVAKPDMKKVKVTRYTSNALFLPEAVQERLTVALKAADGEPVKFGFRFTAMKNGKGFQWKIEQVIAPAVSDPLEPIRQQVMPKGK